MRKFALLALALVLVLCSCSSIKNGASVENFLGEEVIAEFYSEHGREAEFKKILSVICANGEPLYEFSSPKKMASLYRDRILSYLVNTGYAKYTGNAQKIAEAEKKYPKKRISILVPESDFEYLVYSNFGGENSVKHENGVVFTYLSKVNAYTVAGQVAYIPDEIEIQSVKETENTYIVNFYSIYGGVYSKLHRAVFVKRSDGTLYLGKLDAIADEKIVIKGGVSDEEE